VAGAAESSWPARAAATTAAAPGPAPGSAPASTGSPVGGVGGGTGTHLLAWQPPRIALGLALAAVLAHGLLHGLAAPFGSAPLAGAALAGAGGAWAAWAWACLRLAGTPLRPTAAPRLLVDHGPYALGRHPMYLGIAVAQAGIALALGVPLLLAAAAAFLAIVARVHVPHEEAALKLAFGGWYSDYAAQVRRWI